MAGTPTEGTVDRPYHQNPPRLFREVHWRGGTFTVGLDRIIESTDGDSTNAIFLRGAKTWAETKTLSGEGITIYENRAGAFGIIDGTQTFVLAGGATVFGVGPAGFQYQAWIETSTDGGETWRRRYDADDSFVVATVYDKENSVFYAQATADDASARAGTGDFLWQVLRSVDGISWGVVETAPGGPANSRYASPIMTAAADPIYKDGAGNNCPGGVYGYDKAQKILMAPYPNIEVFASEARFSGFQMQIRQDYDSGAPTFTYVDIPDMDRVFSAAYAGGIWQAAGSGDGGAVIATSTDNGETWETTYTAGPVGSHAKIALGSSL